MTSATIMLYSRVRIAISVQTTVEPGNEEAEMRKKSGGRGLTLLCVFAAVAFGAVTSEAQSDSLNFGTDYAAEMAAHNVAYGWGIMEAARYAIGGFGDEATWDMTPSGAGPYALEVVLGIGTARKVTVEWVVNGVTNSSGLLVGGLGFEIVTNRYALTVPSGVSTIECKVFTPPEASTPSIYSSALYAGDNSVDFGSDHEIDMASQGTTLLPDAGSVTVDADRIACGGDWASVEWDLATAGAGQYALQVGVGIGSSRHAEVSWVVSGVTNFSGVLIGSSGYEEVTNLYAVTIPAGVSTIHCVFDDVLGQASVLDAALLGPMDNVVNFGTDYSGDMAVHNTVGPGWGVSEPTRMGLGAFADEMTWDLATSGDGSYSLEVVVGIGTSRKMTVEWVVNGVTNDAGLLVGVTGYEIVTNRYALLVSGGASVVECRIYTPNEAVSNPYIYSAMLYGPGDNSVDFGSDHDADMASQGTTLLPDASHTVYADRIACNGDWASVEWYLAASGAGKYNLDVGVGIGSGRKAEISWVVNGVTNFSGEFAGTTGYEETTNSYLVVIPGGVSTIRCVFDDTLGSASVLDATLDGPLPPNGATVLIR